MTYNSHNQGIMLQKQRGILHKKVNLLRPLDYICAIKSPPEYRRLRLSKNHIP